MNDPCTLMTTSAAPKHAPRANIAIPVVTGVGVTAAKIISGAANRVEPISTGRLPYLVANRPASGIKLIAPIPVIKSIRPRVAGSATRRSRVAGIREIHVDDAKPFRASVTPTAMLVLTLIGRWLAWPAFKKISFRRGVGVQLTGATVSSCSWCVDEWT